VVPIRPVSAEPLEYSLFDFVLPGTSLFTQGAQNVLVVDSSCWQHDLKINRRLDASNETATVPRCF